MFSDKFGLTQAVLDGRKTMTRRLEMDINLRFYLNEYENTRIVIEDNRTCVYSNEEELLATKPNRYKVGEVIAIAQRYMEVDDYYKAAFHRKISIHGMTVEPLDGISANDIRRWRRLSDSLVKTLGWNNKMYVKSELMPHHIRITDIKVERLQDISEEDCLKEGIQYLGLEYEDYGDPQYAFQDSIPYTCAKDAFSRFIDKVQGKGRWNSNPYVWAYEFELID